MTGTCEYCGKRLCVICGCCNCKHCEPPAWCVHTEEQRRTAERRCLECGNVDKGGLSSVAFGRLLVEIYKKVN